MQEMACHLFIYATSGAAHRKSEKNAHLQIRLLWKKCGSAFPHVKSVGTPYPPRYIPAADELLSKAVCKVESTKDVVGKTKSKHHQKRDLIAWN